MQIKWGQQRYIKLVTVLFVLSSCLLVQATETRETYIKYSDYLSKLISADMQNKIKFESLLLSDFDEEILTWIYQVDQELERYVASDLDAEFEFSIGEDNKISQLKLVSLPNVETNDFANYRDFVASLLNFEFPEYSNVAYGKAKCLAEYKFKLSTKYLYLHRHVSFDQLVEGAAVDLDLVAKTHNEHQGLLELFRASSSLSVELLQPSHIDFPKVGEDIWLSLKKINGVFPTGIPATYSKNILLKAKLVDVSNKQMVMQIEKFVLDVEASQQVLLVGQGSYWSYKQEHKFDSQRVLDSALLGGMQAGIASSVSSHGIAPAATAVLGLGSGLVHEMQAYRSYHLSRGKSFSLERVGGVS